jgi:hypothetical protein
VLYLDIGLGCEFASSRGRNQGDASVRQQPGIICGSVRAGRLAGELAGIGRQEKADDQIFGRAGRPGYETSGVGYICTTQDKLEHYLYSIMAQVRLVEAFGSVS